MSEGMAEGFAWAQDILGPQVCTLWQSERPWGSTAFLMADSQFWYFRAPHDEGREQQVLRAQGAATETLALPQVLALEPELNCHLLAPVDHMESRSSSWPVLVDAVDRIGAAVESTSRISSLDVDELWMDLRRGLEGLVNAPVNDQIRGLSAACLSLLPYGESLTSELAQRVPFKFAHGDLHRGNILEGPEGPVVIDWSDAVRAPIGFDLFFHAIDPIRTLAMGETVTAECSLIESWFRARGIPWRDVRSIAMTAPASHVRAALFGFPPAADGDFQYGGPWMGSYLKLLEGALGSVAKDA